MRGDIRVGKIELVLPQARKSAGQEAFDVLAGIGAGSDDPVGEAGIEGR